MRADIFAFLLTVILEASSKELSCDFVSERRVVQECLAPFLNKLDFGQFLLARQFIDAPLTMCKFYDVYRSCINRYTENCRMMGLQTVQLFDEICSSNYMNLLSKHRACFNTFQDYFIFSPECFHSSMLRSDLETKLFRSENQHDEIGDRKCSYMQWYLNCSLNDAYTKACPVAAEMVQTYYELLLNANQSSCDLRTVNPTFLVMNFAVLDNITDSIGNFDEAGHSLPDGRNTTERCDVASERYALELTAEVKAQEDLGYQLFNTPFHELIRRTSCKAYRKYKKSVQRISPQCRRMSTQLERLYDYYCSDEFYNLVSKQQSCIEQLHGLYNGSDCSNLEHFEDEYDAVFNKETSDLSPRRCEFTKWYVGCGVTESFYEACPQIAEAVQSYFELLINANQSDCDLRQPTADRNNTIADAETGSFDCQLFNNCTTADNCTDGFYYDKRSGKCIDVDECESNRNLCSQKCINKPGSYECICEGPLYRLARNGRQCYRTDDEAVTFFLAHSQSVWNITHDAKSYLKLLPNDGAEKVAMFDYDVKEKKLYYMDLVRSSLQYVSLTDRARVHTVQNHDVEGTEGIAVDWVHRNLYTLRQHQLHVQLLDGFYRTTLYKGLFRLPRALVAYPRTRELFASDWAMEPFIARLAMDGTEATKIVTDDLVWPNALAVDYFAERLYWADAFRDVIEMSNLDGTGRRAVISNSAQIPHVFGLSVFDDAIFWSDWTNRGLLFADKLTGRNLTMLVGTVLPPYFIKAYHSAMQMPGPNICKSATCQHVCVPKLDGSGPKCLCADGFTLEKNGACKPNCKKHEFLCQRPDHKCLNLMYRCDGTYNCVNAEDESGCPLPICQQDERMFPCHDNRKCILRSQRCDGFVDCFDSSDELYCADVALTWSH